MKANRGLGRGLDALMPEIPQEDARERVMMLRMGDIDPNPEQPRRKFDAQALAELAASIRQVGVLQPILVTEIEGRYRIIAGERRWRAARLAELEEIPAIVRPLDEIERMEAALIENIQREDLNPLEEALAVRALMEKCGLTQEKAAERLGRSRPAASAYAARAGAGNAARRKTFRRARARARRRGRSGAVRRAGGKGRA